MVLNSRSFGVALPGIEPPGQTLYALDHDSGQRTNKQPNHGVNHKSVYSRRIEMRSRYIHMSL